jgi:hypothetical protein
MTSTDLPAFPIESISPNDLIYSFSGEPFPDYDWAANFDFDGFNWNASPAY